MAALCAPLFLASCSDDSASDWTPSVSIEGGVNNVTLNREDGDFTLGVAANGSWTAEVVGEDADWLSLITSEGNGAGSVRYIVEPNTTDLDREARIDIKCGDKTVSYTVRQTTVSEVDDVLGENAGETDYSLFGATVPIGYGMHIKGTSSMTRFNAGQIFNVKNLDKEEVQEYMDGEYVTMYEEPTTKVNLISGKEFRDKSQHIGAKLSVNIQFGLFKLGLKGAFNMFEGTVDTTYNYSASASVPLQTATLEYSSILDDYENLPENLQKLVLTNSFTKLRDQIQELVASGADTTSQELNKALKSLDSKFGPVFCSEAQLGGTTNVSLALSSSEAKDTLAISGELSAGFTSLFSLDVTASADFLSTSRASLENSELNVSVTGGSKTARTDLVKAMRVITDPNTSAATVNETLIDAIGKWSETIDVNTPGNFTCTDYSLIGIWELFTDEEAREVVKEYMRKQYPNNADGTSPYLVDIQRSAEESL